MMLNSSNSLFGFLFISIGAGGRGGAIFKYLCKIRLIEYKVNRVEMKTLSFLLCIDYWTCLYN